MDDLIIAKNDLFQTTFSWIEMFIFTHKNTIFIYLWKYKFS